MGLLAIGVGGGLGEGLENIGKHLMGEAAAESALQRNMAMLREKMSMESEQRRADKTWEMDESQRRMDEQNKKLNARATELAGSRFTNTDEDVGRADAAAKAYNDALSRGEISQEDANKAYAEAGNYLKRNEQKNTVVSDDDYAQAARETGLLSAKDYLSYKSKDSDREMRLLIQQGNIESALKIAQLKGDIAMAMADIKAEAKAGNAKASDFVAGMAELDVRFPNATQEEKLRMWQNRNAGEKGYTDTEYDEDGRVVGKKTRTAAGNAAQPTTPGKQFKWTPSGVVPR